MTRKALREKIGNKALRMKKRGIHKPFFLLMRQLFWLLKEPTGWSKDGGIND